MEICIKRVYEEAEPEDGYRVLVDRLWPRGLSKESIKFNSWEKELTPSTDLRQAWHTGMIGNEEFFARYEAELHEDERLAAAKKLISTAWDCDRITLLVATRNVLMSHAQVLKRVLESLLDKSASKTNV